MQILSIVLPAYNEEDNIGPLVAELTTILPELKQRIPLHVGDPPVAVWSNVEQEISVLACHVCKQVDPVMVETGVGHVARCHLFDQPEESISKLPTETSAIPQSL